MYYSRRSVALCIFALIMTTNCHVLANSRSQKTSTRSIRIMARAQMSAGNYSQAAELFENAYQLASDSKASDEEMSLCLNDLAYVYLREGRLTEAERTSKMGLEYQKKAYGGYHPYMAYSLKNLCGIYIEQEKTLEAERAITRAMAIILEYHNPDDRVLGPFYVEKARVLALKSQFQEAEGYFKWAYKITVGHYGEKDLNTAKVMLAMAEFYAETGRVEIAKSLSEKALRAYENCYGQGNHQLWPALLNRAMVCIAGGEYLEAEGLFSRAISAVERAGDEDCLGVLLGKIDGLRQGF